ncbi:hypothetical protein [Magnetospirillum sp. 64-120]|uniref:hypothetical protein n=1 Tax=Magnetospirillum sp. 64-120 TaxID=1895778 RepID=UPI000928E2EB|nr:hypothetical protein [Magnetospirillum sp. 64-120]OJX79983.1 MAG: hypothetical protein BGO92_03495 [Magnetospirillum sp. 64-120]
MTVGDFSDLLDRLGSDLAQWPEPQRRAAEALLERSSSAAQALAEALKLADDVKTSQPKAPPGLADRIIAAAGSEKPKN